MDLLQVMESGPLVTVQDLGRFGFQQYGVPVSGGLDKLALRTANLLVGNQEDEAALELTFLGLKLNVLAPVRLALTGADMPVSLNDRSVATWSAFEAAAGDVVTIKPARSGLRGYLAVAGGFDVPLVMGSRSTYVGGGLGGFEGRPLAKGDVLAGSGRPVAGRTRALTAGLIPERPGELVLHAVPGPQDDFFDHGADVFFTQPYVISSQADRMGYRLEGPVVEIKPDYPQSIISEPSLAGAVQIPADGQPIVLLVEQTVGGYAKIATVITPDLDLIAQARPGERISFTAVDLDRARELDADYQTRLQEIRQSLT